MNGERDNSAPTTSDALKRSASLKANANTYLIFIAIMTGLPENSANEKQIGCKVLVSVLD